MSGLPPSRWECPSARWGDGSHRPGRRAGRNPHRGGPGSRSRTCCGPGSRMWAGTSKPCTAGWKNTPTKSCPRYTPASCPRSPRCITRSIVNSAPAVSSQSPARLTRAGTRTATTEPWPNSPCRALSTKRAKQPPNPPGRTTQPKTRLLHRHLTVRPGVRLYAPGAHVVATRQVGEVTEALAHTTAARGLLCVYGDPGHGKTLALHQALRLLPRRLPVRHAVVSVKPALPQLRAALLTAFGLPATSLTNRTDAADRALLDALQTPGVLVVDDVQRIAAPELDYLRRRTDDTHVPRPVRRWSRAHPHACSRAGLTGTDLATGAPP